MHLVEELGTSGSLEYLIVVEFYYNLKEIKTAPVKINCVDDIFDRISGISISIHLFNLVHRLVLGPPPEKYPF